MGRQVLQVRSMTKGGNRCDRLPGMSAGFVASIARALLARETACQSLSGRLANAIEDAARQLAVTPQLGAPLSANGGTGATRRGVSWTKRDAERGHSRNAIINRRNMTDSKFASSCKN